MAEPVEPQQTDTTQMPQWLTRFNPPGLSELVYRGGRYGRALSQMLAGLLRPLPARPDRGEGEKTGPPPLASLNTEAQQDWTLALVRAWAAVTEVLGFYQERIVNEGYLRTATERRSVLELARTIGYELRPGMAASAALALTVLTTRDEPSRQVVIPAGTAVQSVPAPGEVAQTFETGVEIAARSEWNALRPAHVEADSWPQCPPQEATSARLMGADTGLRPGETILIAGDAPGRDGSEHPWLLATLKTVQPFPERGYTLVTWEEPLVLGGSEPLRNPQAFVMRQQAALYGYTPASVLSTKAVDCGGGPETDCAPAAIWLPNTAVNALAGNARGVLFAGTDLGLFRSANQGESWQPVSVGMVQKNIQALTFDPEGHLLAGTDDGHIYLSKDGGDKWATLNGEQIVLPPRGLAKLWSRGKAPLSKTAIRSLAAYSRGRRRTLVAATDDGVFRSRDQGKNWQPANKDLPKTDAKTGLASVVAWALAVTGLPKKAELYAGTDAGVFHIREGLNLRLMIAATAAVALLGGAAVALLGLSWPDDLPILLGIAAGLLVAALIAVVLVIGARLASRTLSRHTAISLGKPVRALVAGKKGHLFAGTEQGLYRSNDGSAGRRLARLLLGDLARRWQPVSASLTSQDIRALAVDAQGDLLAATGDGSVYRSRDDGETWESFGTGLPLKPIGALWAAKDRTFVAGLPSTVPAESKWSPFQVEQRLIDLDQVYPRISPGNWAVLSDGEKSRPSLYKVTQVEVIDSRDPARPGKFTRITVDRCERLDSFDRTSTLVRIQSESLGLLSDRPVDRDGLTFDRYVPGLQPGQRLIVSGKRMRARLLPQAAESLKLYSDDGLRSVDLEAEESYQVLDVRPGSTPQTKEWRLMTRTGFAGSVTATAEQCKWEPAGDGDEIVSEVVEIGEVEDRPKHTAVTFKSPLANLYDWATVTAYGNVVEATHGRTVEHELLGSSEGLAAHQRFLLKQRPLTYTGATTGPGVESTVKIEVNGVRWKQVTSFDLLDRDTRTFMLRQDDQGNTAVLFGFGARGTGIPSGAEQISATYRRGLGREGNVGAESLHVLQTAVPGLKAVTNPLAASGGADPETMAEAREKAPLSVRAMERIVSLSDYEDFTRQFAGIGKVQARLTSKGSQQCLHITIADTAGNEVAADSDLHKNLAAAIHSSRAFPVPRLVIDSFERIYFRLKARVWIQADHHGRMAEIKEAAETALADAFAFDRREFGQPVAAAEVITLIQGIPGVFAVELEQLYKHGQNPELCLLLEAQGARWDAGGLRPAEMLVIEPIDGIELDLEAAP